MRAFMAMRTVTLLLLALAFLSAGCGDDDTTAPPPEPTTTTTEPPAETVKIRVTAEQVMGCTQSVTRSGLDVGNDSRVEIEDGAGSTLGVGTFRPTPGGGEICDWTAVVDDVTAGADFYTVTAGGEIATVSLKEMEIDDWTVTAHLEITGDVTLR